ncbi:MAG: aminotransferase class V-fold PLP-dependent enzyme [Clostridia bacterium]|nr:aminotransferase class V-fold PLP-dependent enzyme [Clostridia bacterium]
MNTPIFDFVKEYAKSGSVRLHMPGHKGASILGCEALDITEIDGADSLYEASGIIKESENNASLLFGCDTFYSTEGSSQCIRAMLYLALLQAKKAKKKPLVLASRNAHKVLLSAAAMLDFDIEWLHGGDTYLSCDIGAKDVESAILRYSPAAVYLTSPDYLGNTLDIEKISEVCKKHNVLLLVDNAHGAYLRFLENSQFPTDLGADMCCSSAHKTLPVLTGGAYLHIADSGISENAKNALALFGSTSPSYLILQSLDLANKYIDNGYKEKLCMFANEVRRLKDALIKSGYRLIGNEPLKIAVAAKEYGYCGSELAAILKEKGFVCEFCDNDFTVLMLTPENGGINEIKAAMLAIPKRKPLYSAPPVFHKCERIMSVREAAFAENETVNICDALGRVLAVSTVGCPPAVPIVMCGERIDEKAIECFKYYGITKCIVVKNADA